MGINFREKVRSNRLHNSQDSGDREIAALWHFESDRGRIINSAAIRRLQQKTQVFPLERNAAVRSRLTHSMEVQQVGRYISQLIFQRLAKEKGKLEKYGLDGLDRQFESIVEMSCLMHDVGNPPFGHFGEDTMIKWFEKHTSQFLKRFMPDTDDSDIKLNDELTALKRDICNFEGNAQAIRLVHSLLALNLTYSQLSGIMKYTRRGDTPKPDKDYLQKKVGFYLSEAPFIKVLREALNIQEGRRSPFAYIMEAADDISYGVADIEDAEEKGILSIADLPNILREEFINTCQSDDFKLPVNQIMEDIIDSAKSMYRQNKIDSMFFVGLRVGINKELPKYACKRFIDNIDTIFHGSFNNALIEDGSYHHAVVETLKTVARKYAFSTPEVEGQELQGYRIINGLLDIYAPLLKLDRASFNKVLDNDKKAPAYEARVFRKLSQKHIRAYRSAIEEKKLAEFKKHFENGDLKSISDDAWEFYFRCRLIQDYISGMTDQFAYDEYRALHVID
ncbi:dGTPase [Marinomonas spartinae]|uniref:dGTPase n=1 Tax=Marinomonas spartinae TaxID=1792290 RepID=UPI0018F1D3E9|nr:dGTPase [Marinomonas spartinae]MBJ7556642.1 dGTPase [Marinomonas spartinae]